MITKQELLELEFSDFQNCYIRVIHGKSGGFCLYINSKIDEVFIITTDKTYPIEVKILESSLDLKRFMDYMSAYEYVGCKEHVQDQIEKGINTFFSFLK